MKVKNKILTVMVFSSILSGLIIPNKANAALQSNGGTPATKSMNSWILQIRQMQEIGGTLGRADTISTNNLTSNATDLDIHMEKNTEYGAMAILSASAYGNPNKINDGETTTGNSTGIVMRINNEWVAALSSSDAINLKNAASRYKNIYTKEEKYKVGDAIKETYKWHGAKENFWIAENINTGLLRSRNGSGSIFNYWGRGYNNWETDVSYGYGEEKLYHTRAVIVVGTGL